MKLGTVLKGGDERIVAGLGNDRIVDVAALLADRGEPVPHGMQDLIRTRSTSLGALARALDAAAAEPELWNVEPDAWLPPVPRPGKVCAVAMNNSASNARKISAPDHPAFFLKAQSCLIGHGEPIRVRPYYGSVHPEPELAVVIGGPARDVPAETALDYVFGYTIFNDVTGNGMRAEDMFHYWAVYPKKDNPEETERVEQHLSYAARYKGADTFGVLGPWIVTADEIADPDDLAVSCTVHGEVIAEDSTRYYNYKVAEVVSFISYFQTLNPGDVVSLGTAFKPGENRKSIHHANFLTVPGPVEIRIAGLGTQTNPVVIENAELGPWRLS